jgi:hypothetical protein
MNSDAAAIAQQCASIEAHVRARAGDYLGVEAGVETFVSLMRIEPRATSRIYRYQLAAGTAKVGLLVKAALTTAGAAGQRDRGVPDRPRIVPFSDAAERYSLEFRALRRVERHFGECRDARIGAVRVFDMIPSERAVVMEALDRPTLRTLALQQGRLLSGAGARQVEEAFFNAGTWLQRYHGLVAGHGVEDVCTTREEAVEFSARLTGYLAQYSSAATFAEAIRSTFAKEAAQAFPPELPLGLSHSDYAMRNIIVAPTGAVSVIDMLGRHRMPVYRDVAGFLANLQYSWVPALAGGSVFYMQRRGAYAQEFVRGYFGDNTIPIGAMRLFHAQALLERWCSIIARVQAAGRGTAGTRACATLMVASRVFQASISQALNASWLATVPRT